MTNFWKLRSTRQDTINMGKGDPSDNFFQVIDIPVGQIRIKEGGLVLARMAAKYPSLMADLKEVGLNPDQHDRYYALMESARITMVMDQVDWVPSEADKKPTAVEEKNIVFMKAHDVEIKEFY